MITITNLYKSFDDVQILKGINLDIPQGTIYGIIGRSGSGKSTLLRCINGLVDFHQGEIIIDNEEISTLNQKDSRSLRKSIGMIFQNFSLLNRLSVYENIALPMRCWGYDQAQIKEKVTELLALVGLTEKADYRPQQLSGGQKQRVAIARALSLEPKILLCDEATSALDPRTTESIIKLLKDIRDELGITIVVVTHQMEVIKSLCDKVAIIEDGKIQVQGDLTTILLDKPQSFLNLLGKKNYKLPERGKNLEIFLFNDNKARPLISELTLSLNINCCLVHGEFDNDLFDTLVVNIEDEKVQQVTNYLNDQEIAWSIL